MKRILFSAALLLTASTAFAAESIQATVRHMCCGACKNAATTGLKKLDWADQVAIDGTTVTVTAKADQKVDVVSLLDAMSKAGFPATEINTSGPVTLTIAHLCCPGCTNDLKTKIGEIRSMVLDKENVKIDATAKTLTLQPLAGMKLNLVAILNQLGRSGFSASKCTVTAAAAAGTKVTRKSAVAAKR